ncbi:MAG: DNA translocase FtsK [Lachnospiraceae bacterium]|nr:DNA translocase FtsK [Lachnospiraceae bacterium]
MASSDNRRRQTTGKKSGSAKTSTRKTAGSGSAKGRQKQQEPAVVVHQHDNAIGRDILLIVVYALSVLIFISLLGAGGVVGKGIRSLFFGLFGTMAYVFPFVLSFGLSFYLVNEFHSLIRRKMTGLVVVYIVLCVLCQLILVGYERGSSVMGYYAQCGETHLGGGLLGGAVVTLFGVAFGTIGAYLLTLTALFIGLIILTQKPLLSNARKKEMKRQELRREKREMLRRMREEEALEAEALLAEADDDSLLEHEDKAVSSRYGKSADGTERRKRGGTFKLPDFRKEKKEAAEAAKAAAADETLASLNINEDSLMAALEPEKTEASSVKAATEAGPVAEAKPAAETKVAAEDTPAAADKPADRKKETSRISEEFMASLRRSYRPAERVTLSDEDGVDNEAGSAEARRILKTLNTDPVDVNQLSFRDESAFDEDNDFASSPMTAPAGPVELPGEPDAEAFEAMMTPDVNPDDEGLVRRHAKPRSSEAAIADSVEAVQSEIDIKEEEEAPKPYEFPTVDLLTPGKASDGDSSDTVMETAEKLQQTFDDFGVGVHVVGVSRGPTVTRYELQPDHGVKVSRIVALTDDIKLNLAAADIRIEAPIPGKAAVGIEVPNKEPGSVMLREMLETPEFEKFSKPLAFAVGKDIGGRPIVTDIAKMPHLLIAGATGSGKSVCINTLIMSILFKSSPEDVKMVMIDPKVVELKIYDGIPHLLIPVVTDVKKASGALNWAVAEMTERYNKFSAMSGVRDIESYNKRIEEIKADPRVDEEEKANLKKLPRIVVIVDELADLMMVAPGEVEDAICRLAQLARAAGIHVIIATQRPSVNVVTGLIKANMPSRIALSVTSGVDSRTILDMNGAEKLLGKGDMLFYPQSFPTPMRVQGCYVSDEDITRVVDFLKGQGSGSSESEIEEIQKKINESSNNSTSAGGVPTDGRDEYFWDAGKLIIDKDKASIGMLQRYFKIGFNRAARIMDQLAEAGVVGPEEGTKARTILMSQEQFENMTEQGE